MTAEPVSLAMCQDVEIRAGEQVCLVFDFSTFTIKYIHLKYAVHNLDLENERFQFMQIPTVGYSSNFGINKRR